METPRPNSFGFYGSASFGVLFWRGDTENGDSCGPFGDICIINSAHYATGREQIVALQFGLRFQLARHLTLEPYIEGSRSIGGKTGGLGEEASNTVRFGISAARRP
jgi:hypothetical protein